MNPFDILISLPTSLACSVLRDWLSLKSIAALDSAYCNKLNRSFFEELLRCDEYYIRETITLLKHNAREVWNGLPKFGRMLRSVAFQRYISEAEDRLVTHHCSDLTHVHIKMYDCQPALRKVLEANKKIEYMYLDFYTHRNNRGTERYFPEGMTLPKLRALAMVGVGIKHEHIVEALQLSNNITRLQIKGSVVGESTVLQIALLCPHLSALGLPDTYVTDVSLSQLKAPCPPIKHLDFGLNHLTDAGILAVVQNLTGLESLNIKYNYHLTDASLVNIYTHCANTLETLHINCVRENGVGNLFGATAVHELLERCTKLRTFYFGYCVYNGRTIDCGITIPAAALASLTELVLNGDIACERNLLAISKYGANLTTLGFGGNIHIHTDASSMGLLEECAKLTRLYVDATRDVVRKWTENRPGVVFGDTLPLHLHCLDVLNM